MVEMSSVVEDWLSDEKFDFDVSPSPVNGDDCLLMNEKESEDDDEEVFFGPQTFKEKVVAAVVNEKEAIHQPLEKLNPEEQALLLRESALLSLMIKHGTPKSLRPSPVAVVHPMKREDENKELKELLLKTNLASAKEEDKENCVIKPSTKMSAVSSSNNEDVKLKASGILHPKFTSKPRIVSEPTDVGMSTKLPVSKTRGKIHSEFSENVVDPTILYGLSGKMSNKPMRRRSGLPVKQVSEGAQSKVKPVKPSLLPSAIPSTRTKVTSVSKVDSKLKPIRATSLSGSTVSQSQLKLPTSRKSAAVAQGTPSKSNKKLQNLSSLRRQNSLDLKQSSTPGGGKVLLRTTESQKRSTSLVTPVQRTPSTRKLITGRQLINAKTEEKTVESGAKVEKSGANIEKSGAKMGKPNVDNVITRKVEDVNNQKNDDVSTFVMETNIKTNINSNTTGSLPSHTDIINRYRKLKEKENTSPTDQDANEISHGTTEVLDDGESKCNLVPNPVDESGREPRGATANYPIGNIMKPLLELGHESPLLQLSPAKTQMNHLDPFQTGVTPPPLIDIGDVLQPERPSETNLIEF